MPCFHPLTAYQTVSGEVVWNERGDIVRSLFLPCGNCIGCRLERSRQWAVRVMHESQLFEENCFVTLTYDDEHVPGDGSLRYLDFQKFLKRLRKRWQVRFFCAGEYGEKDWRPHFHSAIFGYAFRSDRKHWKKLESGSWLDRSAELEKLWPFGFSSVGDLTFESAAYIARYVVKKVNGDLAESHYRRVDCDTGEVTWLTPEFVHMSLKPGIGREWFEKFGSEVFPHDRVVARGVPGKPPKYYDRLQEAKSKDVMDVVRESRILRFNRADNVDSRLEVKERVAAANLKRYRRKI